MPYKNAEDQKRYSTAYAARRRKEKRESDPARHINCPQCGTSFFRMGTAKYCSRRCAVKARKPQVRSTLEATCVRHKITVTRFREIMESQGGKCAICGDGLTVGRGSDSFAHIDHDHKTGLVRGLLCGPCNRTIGHAKEDPRRLSASAIEYLKESNATQAG